MTVAAGVERTIAPDGERLDYWHTYAGIIAMTTPHVADAFQYNSGVSGAASFTKAVYDRLILSAGNVRLFATYDATMPSGLQYGCQEMADMYHALLADI